MPVLHFEREELRLGGTGNVAADLAKLNADVVMIATVGADETGKQARRLLARRGFPM